MQNILEAENDALRAQIRLRDREIEKLKNKCDDRNENGAESANSEI